MCCEVGNKLTSKEKMADNLSKKTPKGILKNSSSFDKQETQAQAKKNKETTWDEMNIIATLHPADKDYGHMKIEEPKTPFSYGNHDELDASTLMEKLQSDRPAKVLEESEDEEEEDEEEELSPEEKALKKEFEMKRKAHYNEYYAVKLARKLLEEEDEDDENEDERGEKEDRPSCSRNVSTPSTNDSSDKK